MPTYVINGTSFTFPDDFDPYGYVTKLPELLGALLAMAASFGATFPFDYDSSTTEADPGNGDFRLDAAPASATEAYVDNLTSTGVTITSWLDSFDNGGNSSDRGILRIQDVSAADVVHFYRVSGTVTDETGFRKIPLTWLGGNGSFTNGSGVLFSFAPRGADGAPGGTGDPGDDGNDGWSPVFAIASDGARRVLQVDDWVGGEGSKPATGDYVGASGLTSTIGDAVDIRGGAGTDGDDGADGADPFYLMTFDTGTSASGISGGQVRANNLDLSAASAIYVSDTNRAGSSIAARILELGAAGKTVKDRLIITNPAADTQASWLVDSITDESGYTTIAVSGHAGATSFADDLAISLQTIMSGEDGSDGSGAGDIVGPASSTNNNIAAFDGTDGKLLKDGGIATSAIVTLDGSQTLTNKTLSSPAISTPTGLVKGDVGLGNVTNDAQVPASYLDTDTALAANSDTKVATQKATKAYADTKIPSSYLDTDTTLAANSDTKVATQKAVKAYADTLIAAQDAMVFKGVQDCSGNPNYPAGNRGDTYRVSVAGKIGGASGPNVEVGDMFICLTDSTSSGNHATVGSNWSIIQTNLDGAVIGPASVTDERIAVFDGTTGKLLKQASVAIAALAALAGNQNLTGGFTATCYDIGSVTGSNQTITPSIANGHYQKATLNGSSLTGTLTFAVPSAGDGGVVVQVINGGSGAVGATLSTSGYTKVTGDTYATTNGNRYNFHITRIDSRYHLHVQALQ